MRRATVASLVVGALLAGATAPAVGARAVSFPAALVDARQMILVTTASWDVVQGSLQVFERAPGGGWVPAPLPIVGTSQTIAVPIVVGQKGMAWDAALERPTPGPVKMEGDGRSPAGVFGLSRAFGFAPPSAARWLKLPYVELTPALECVDDPGSSSYNQLVDGAQVPRDWTSSEKMRSIAPAYTWGVVVDYNTSPAVPRRGSCVFLHVGGVNGRGTAGCTAMASPQLEAVMRWLDPSRKPVLVQLPLPAYAALRAPWRLPPAVMASGIPPDPAR